MTSKILIYKYQVRVLWIVMVAVIGGLCLSLHYLESSNNEIISFTYFKGVTNVGEINWSRPQPDNTNTTFSREQNITYASVEFPRTSFTVQSHTPKVTENINISTTESLPLPKSSTKRPFLQTTNTFKAIYNTSNYALNYEISLTLNNKYLTVHGKSIKCIKSKTNKNHKNKIKNKIHWRYHNEIISDGNNVGLESLYFEDVPYTSASVPDILKKDQPKKYEHSKQPLKKILYWNEAYNMPHFGFGYGQKPFQLANCAETRCFATSDRDAFPIEDVDAIVWHLRSQDHSFPEIRSNKTRYVFWMVESASNTFMANISDFNNIFNWTFTNRLDSDIPNPYGLALPRKYRNLKYLRKYNHNKTKMAAWFVSNCHTQSERMILAQNLQKYINIDIYGKCGWLNCPRKNQNDCYEMIERDYKFYLSFENSLCIDYITEKFFNILKYDVVPVVYGLGNLEEVAPPYSYIDVFDFPNLKSLADYLMYLDKNDTAYREYFRWKEDYGMIKGWTLGAIPWCSLCKKLNEDKSTKVYEDLQSWFIGQSQCIAKSRNRSISNFIHDNNK